MMVNVSGHPPRSEAAEKRLSQPKNKQSQPIWRAITLDVDDADPWQRPQGTAERRVE